MTYFRPNRRPKKVIFKKLEISDHDPQIFLIFFEIAFLEQQLRPRLHPIQNQNLIAQIFLGSGGGSRKQLLYYPPPWYELRKPFFQILVGLHRYIILYLIQ